MIKKTAVVLCIIILLVLAFKLTLTQAQRYDKESGSDYKDDLSVLEDKVDKILSALPERNSQDSANRQIIAKLDLILQNQQRIFDDLDVIKVRASVKR